MLSLPRSSPVLLSLDAAKIAAMPRRRDVDLILSSSAPTAEAGVKPSLPPTAYGQPWQSGIRVAKKPNATELVTLKSVSIKNP